SRHTRARQSAVISLRSLPQHRSVPCTPPETKRLTTTACAILHSLFACQHFGTASCRGQDQFLAADYLGIVPLRHSPLAGKQSHRAFALCWARSGLAHGGKRSALPSARQLAGWAKSVDALPFQGQRRLSHRARSANEAEQKARAFRVNFLKNLKPT